MQSKASEIEFLTQLYKHFDIETLQVYMDWLLEHKDPDKRKRGNNIAVSLEPNFSYVNFAPFCEFVDFDLENLCGIPRFSEYEISVIAPILDEYDEINIDKPIQSSQYYRIVPKNTIEFYCSKFTLIDTVSINCSKGYPDVCYQALKEHVFNPLIGKIQLRTLVLDAIPFTVLPINWFPNELRNSIHTIFLSGYFTRDDVAICSKVLKSVFKSVRHIRVINAFLY